MFKKQSSFTLIELLIVIAIISIFTALSLGIIVSLRNQRQVKTVAEQVKTRIMEAHSFAVAPDKDATSSMTGIQVKIGSTLQISEINNSGTVLRDLIPTPDTLSSKISFTPATVIINFSATGNNIGQIINISGSSAPTPSGGNVSFSIKSTAKTYIITVNQLTGSVNIN